MILSEKHFESECFDIINWKNFPYVGDFQQEVRLTIHILALV